MATSFLKSFIEAVNPAVGKAAKRVRDSQGRKTKRRMRPQTAPDAPSMELSSKATLERRSTRPEIVVVPELMQEQVVEGENVLEVSGEEIPSMELAEQIAIHRQIPVMDSEVSMDNTNSDPVLMSVQQEVNDSESEAGDIVRDAQFFQDAATEYQLAYQSLDEKYTQQAVLVKQASEGSQSLWKPCYRASRRVNGSKAKPQQWHPTGCQSSGVTIWATTY